MWLILLPCWQALDLEGEEWDQFAEGIASLAAASEKKPAQFKLFQVSKSDCSNTMLPPTHPS